MERDVDGHAMRDHGIRFVLAYDALEAVLKLCGTLAADSWTRARRESVLGAETRFSSSRCLEVFSSRDSSYREREMGTPPTQPKVRRQVLLASVSSISSARGDRMSPRQGFDFGLFCGLLHPDTGGGLGRYLFVISPYLCAPAPLSACDPPIVNICGSNTLSQRAEEGQQQQKIPARTSFVISACHHTSAPLGYVLSSTSRLSLGRPCRLDRGWGS